MGLTKWLAVVGGGGNEQQPVFRRCTAPEKIEIVPFGKLWVNSLEVTTAVNWWRVRRFLCSSDYMF